VAAPKTTIPQGGWSFRAPASVAAEARGSLAEDIGLPLSAVAEVFAAEVVEAFAVAAGAVADAVRTSGSSTMWCYWVGSTTD
jgi:hypothetical protein